MVKRIRTLSAEGFRESLVTATRLHQAGDLAGAERIYRQVLASKGASPDVAYLLGVIEAQTGRLAPAVKSFRAAARGDPGVVDYRLALATALQMLGRIDEAEKEYGEACRLNPSVPELHNNLGGIAQSRGDWTRAEQAFREAVRLRPDFHQARCNLGGALLNLGRLEEAESEFRAALAGDGGLAEAHFGLGRICELNHQYADAGVAYRRMIELAPEDAKGIGALAGLYARSGTPSRALPLYREARRLDAANIEWSMGEIAALAELGELVEALASVSQLVDAHARDPRLLKFYGDLLMQAGKHDEAISVYRRVIGLDPASYDVYLNIADARKYGEGAPEIAEFEALLGRVGDEAGSAVIHFALGKLYEDAGAYAEAFGHYREGNRMKRREAMFSIEEHRGVVNRMIEVFSFELFRERAGRGDPSDLPVFVVGMPRSGTTLTESIIASHSRAFGAGELGDIKRIAGYLASHLAHGALFPQGVEGLAEEIVAATAGHFVANLRDLAPDASRVVDKMPGNFLYVGLIHYLFPNARIVHVVRDPLDTCLSIYFQYFGVEAHPYSWDLEEIGLYCREYRRLMAHWRRVLPPQVYYEFRYEDLVADSGREARKLVEFCGLEWEDQCLAFHEKERSVMTASHWQVRQPIYRRSVERWRHYEPFLDGLRLALGG